jgi:hypothetical protein
MGVTKFPNGVGTSDTNYLGSSGLVLGTKSSAIADHVITWTANAPTAASTQTIADGTGATDAETAQSIQNINTKLNLVLAALRANGIITL